MQITETRWTVHAYWQPRYCWLGLMWNWTSNHDDPYHPERYPLVEQLHIMICLIPCLPIEVRRIRTTYLQAGN